MSLFFIIGHTPKVDFDLPGPFNIFTKIDWKNAVRIHKLDIISSFWYVTVEFRSNDSCQENIIDFVLIKAPNNEKK